MHTDAQHSFGSICWVELATSDPTAAQEFYGALLGWDYEDGHEDGEFIYSMIRLGHEHVAGMLQLRPHQMEAHLPPLWSPFVCVEDAYATTQQCLSLGAQVLAGPQPVFNSGVMAALADPDGVWFSLWQPKTLKGFQVLKEPNSYLWADRYALNAPEDAEFYKAAFDWDLDDVSSPDNPGYYMFSQTVGGGIDEWDRYLAGVLQLRPGQSASLPYWNVYFQVADLDASLQNALDLGGEQLRPVVENAMGRLVGIQDPQGASFTIMQMAPLHD